jgi:CTP synthase
VQVIPHITDEIKAMILSLQKTPEPAGKKGKNCPAETDVDVAIIEIGGTVGDIESQPFLEAIRQLRGDLGKDNCLFIHLTLVPYLAKAGEHKTKPTQHSVKELRSIGIQPDIILCRCETPVSRELKDKIALFCDVDKDAVFSSIDVDHVYKLPLEFYDEGLDQKVAIMLRLPARNADLAPWLKLVHDLDHPEGLVTIGVVGKYVELKEAYKSLHEALVHGGVANRVDVELKYINAEEVNEDTAEDILSGLDGILVPGGFGDRGVEGKIATARYAREGKIPFFGICLGLQCAVIEYARHMAGLDGANSEEFDPESPHKVIYLMTEWYDLHKQCTVTRTQDSDKGGTMRLGSYPCDIVDDTLAMAAYGEKSIFERHRHRYEVNNDYREALEKAGLIISGVSPDGNLVEMVELKDHPWFLGCQFHPEFKSNPMHPHPLFREFIAAAKKQRVLTGTDDRVVLIAEE